MATKSPVTRHALAMRLRRYWLEQEPPMHFRRSDSKGEKLELGEWYLLNEAGEIAETGKAVGQTIEQMARKVGELKRRERLR